MNNPCRYCHYIYIYIYIYIYCDKSVNKERRTGTGNEEPERGTRLWNEAQETLRPYPNSITGTGNPPCVYMGGRVTLFLDV